VDAVHTIIDNYPKDSSELKKRRDAAKAAAEPYGRMKIARHWLEQIT
jgi:hypothetical protein